MRTQTGVYEVLVGVSDLNAAVAYWRAFGFRPAAQGHLDTQTAQQLYGHGAPLTSIRLEHGSATSGLIRLQQWERSRGRGIGAAALKATGCRWSVQRTDDLLTIWNHAEVEAARSEALLTAGPLLNARTSGTAANAQPFAEPFPASRNLQLFRPESQQVVMQRFNIDVGSYGTLAEDALFKTTEICHVAVVTQSRDVADFYVELGFRRGSETRVAYNPDSVATRMFDLTPDEALVELNLENPRSGHTPAEIRAGRLRVFVVEGSNAADDLREVSRPGQLGYGCYSCAVSEIGQPKALGAAGATAITPILANEFGEPSIGLTAPDGYVWQIVEKPLVADGPHVAK